MKEHKELYQKQVQKVTLHFVWGHLKKKTNSAICINTVYQREVRETKDDIIRCRINYASAPNTTQLFNIYRDSKTHSITPFWTLEKLKKVGGEILNYRDDVHVLKYWWSFIIPFFRWRAIMNHSASFFGVKYITFQIQAPGYEMLGVRRNRD